MLNNTTRRMVALILTLALIAGTMASFTGCSTYAKTEPTETTVTTATTATADETTAAETSPSEVIETVTETVVVTDPKTGETTVQVIEKPVSSNTQKNEPAENKTNSSNTSNSSNKNNTGSNTGSSSGSNSNSGSSSGNGTQTKPGTGSSSQTKPVNKPTTKPTTKPTEPKVSPYDEYVCASNVWLVEDRVIYYLNKYRSTPLTSLNNDIMGDYATYRSQQLVYNFAHDTDDEREAAGALKFGDYFEIEESYWDFEKEEEVYTGKTLKYYHVACGEAIGKGGAAPLHTVDELAEEIVRMFYNSSGHWRYVGSSSNTYGAVGITLDGYKWFVSVCVDDRTDGKDN